MSQSYEWLDIWVRLEKLSAMFLFSLMQILYFVGLLIVNLLTCAHSQGMFHHCAIFGITAQELVTNKLRALGICTQDKVYGLSFTYELSWQVRACL